MKKPHLEINNVAGTITIRGPDGAVLLVLSKEDWSFMLVNPKVR